MLCMRGLAMFELVGHVDPGALALVEPSQVSVEGHYFRKVRLDRVRDVEVSRLRAMRRAGVGRHQRTMTGNYYSIKAGRHQLFESRTERFWLVEADFDSSCSMFAAQGLKFSFLQAWPTDRRSYTPDIVKRVDGRLVLSEVKSGHDGVDAEFYELFAAVVAMVGWRFELLSSFPPGWNNLMFLAPYGRHLPVPSATRDVLDVLALGDASIDQVADVGEQRPFRLAAIFYLLWWHDITTDLSMPLSSATVLSSAIELNEIETYLRHIGRRVLGEAA